MIQRYISHGVEKASSNKPGINQSITTIYHPLFSRTFGMPIHQSIAPC